MSILSRLFGGGATPDPKQVEPETYKDFQIYPEPAKESGKWRLSGRIEKEIDGTVKSHLLIRADTFDSEDMATEATLAKARQVIDEQGARIFT